MNKFIKPESDVSMGSQVLLFDSLGLMRRSNLYCGNEDAEKRSARDYFACRHHVHATPY